MFNHLHWPHLETRVSTADSIQALFPVSDGSFFTQELAKTEMDEVMASKAQSFLDLMRADIVEAIAWSTHRHWGSFYKMNQI